MKKSYNDPDLIDAFLEGRLSQEQLIVFDERLKVDPDFGHKLAKEREIIEGLQSFRKIQLKNQLQNIDISLRQLRYRKLKIGVAFAGLAIISISTLLLFENPFATTTPSGRQSLQKLATSDFISIPVNIRTQLLPHSIIQPVQEKIKLLKSTKEITQYLTPKNKNERQTSFQLNLPSTPDFTLADDFPFEGIESSFDDLAGLSEIHSIGKENHLNIVNEEGSKYNFHYQFEENQLQLYGEFSKEIYQIIELKGKSKDQYFLYFSKNFYQLNNTKGKIIALRKN